MLTAENITVRFKRRDGSSFAALDGVSLKVPDGAAVGLVGESGSGKTTLVRVICGLQKPDAGRVSFSVGSSNRRIVESSNGQTLKPSNSQTEYRLDSACSAGGIQMIFQDAVGALNPRQRVGDAIAEVGRAHGFAVDVDSLLSQVGLPAAVRDRFPSELSGGQCQRICIARALAMRPSLLIGDEPVSALDVSVQARILRLLGDLREKGGLSLLLITHDLAVVSALCDYVYVLEKGHIVEEGDPAAIFAAPSHPYTKRLLDSIPRLPAGTFGGATEG